LAFGALANQAPSDRARIAWRLAAWVVSGVVFAAHIAYSQLRVRPRPRPVSTALQASAGAALGAFVLAVAATAHALQIGASNLALYRAALVVWPAGTAVAAFVAALVPAVALAWLARRRV